MIFSNLLYRLRWFNTPAGILMLLLQRTPVLRMMVSESPGFGLQSGEVLKSAFALVALGAYNSVAGATVFNATAVSPATVTPASGGANTTFTSTIANNSAFSLAFNGTGAPSTIRSWKVTGTLPAGISVTGGTAITGGFVFNGLKVTLSGTPTVSGSQTLSIRAYDSLNASGNNAGITCIVSVTGGVTQVAPAFTTQPATQTVTAGTNVTFSASASGVPTPTLQWYLGTNALTGKTTGTLTLTNVQAVNAGSYTVVATNSAAPSGVSSTAATLTVNPAPVAPAFTTQPATQTVTAGTNVTFSAAASGTPTPTLQWFKDSVAINGQTTATLTLTAVQASAAGSYTVVATNSAAPSGVSSTAATLTVNPAPVAPAFTTQPATQTVTAGTNVTFTSAASGTPPPTLQWFKDSVALNGQTTGTLTLTNVQAVNAGSYTVVATNSAAPSGVSSTAATLTVNPAPVAPAFTTQPAAQTVTAGTNVTFSAAASGTPTPTLQWFRADLLSSGSTATILLAGETRNTLVIANVQASDSGSYFFAVATNSAAPSGVSSTAATLTVGSVSTVPVFTTQPRSQSVILGSNVSFTVVATGTPAPTYQWFKDDVLMPGKTSATLVFTDVQLSDQGYFRVMIYNDATPAGSPSRRVLLQVMTPLEVWRQVNLGTRANTGSAADNADPDGDGVSNLLEYALGGNPGSASSAPSPQISTVRNGNSDYLTLSLTPAVSDVIYQVEVSADLTTWTSTMLTGLTIGQTYTYTDTVAVNTGPHRYLRLRVTSP